MRDVGGANRGARHLPFKAESFGVASEAGELAGCAGTAGKDGPGDSGR